MCRAEHVLWYVVKTRCEERCAYQTRTNKVTNTPRNILCTPACIAVLHAGQLVKASVQSPSQPVCSGEPPTLVRDIREFCVDLQHQQQRCCPPRNRKLDFQALVT